MARPYIAINKAGLFEYTKPNKLVLYGKCFPFPLYRTLLLVMYVFFSFIGLFLIYIGIKFWGIPIFQNTGKSINIYVYFLTSEAIGVVCTWLAFKLLGKMVDIPSKGTLVTALGNIQDNIISYPHVTPEQLVIKE